MSKKILIKILGTIFLLLTGAVVSGVIYFFFLLMLSSNKDDFAKKIEIPIDITERPSDVCNNEYYRDWDLCEKEAFVKGIEDFRMYKDFQPGLYAYQAQVFIDEPGSIYMKAFEITQGVPLSESRLPNRSRITIAGSATSQIIESQDHFTIYEGDWGDEYAARFELWFAPDSGGAERKIAEKNYIIEGWQRYIKYRNKSTQY